MKLIDEIKISVFRPHLYYNMTDESFGKLLRFNIISTIFGLLFYVIYSLIAGIFTKRLGDVIKGYLSYNIPFIIGTILYMWLGIAISALLLSAIFMAISKFNHYNNMNFYKLYNYATHSILPCVLLVSLFGPFVILFSIGYFLMAVRGEAMGAKAGVNPAKYIKR